MNMIKIISARVGQYSCLEHLHFGVCPEEAVLPPSDICCTRMDLLSDNINLSLITVQGE